MRRGISLTKRLDKILTKLDQRLASMSQEAPPQPTGRTKREYVESPIPEIQTLITNVEELFLVGC